MKSYTDISQSKVLSNILPLETADMWYQYTGISIKDGSKKPIYFPMVIRDCESDEDIPCWSLAALLSVLPEYNLQRTDWGNKIEYKIVVTVDDNNYASNNYDNPLDTCVAMIEKLNELKML